MASDKFLMAYRLFGGMGLVTIVGSWGNGADLIWWAAGIGCLAISAITFFMWRQKKNEETFDKIIWNGEKAVELLGLKKKTKINF